MEEWTKPNKTGIIQGKSAPEKRERAFQLRQTMTPAEARLWQFLKGNHLAGLHFRRQQVLDGYIVDFYCHAAGLVVEVDGKIHDESKDYDIARDNVFILRGLRVIRVPNNDVLTSIAKVLQTIYQAAAESGLILPPLELPFLEPSMIKPRHQSTGSPFPLGEGAGGRGLQHP